MVIATKKFSQFDDGGDLSTNQRTAGLLGGNALFNNPAPNLAPGTTAERPVPSAEINGRLRFNTDLQSMEFYSPVALEWVVLENGMDIQSFPYVIYTAEPLLTDAFNLGFLSNGLLKQTVAAGVATPAIAINDTDYYGPGMASYLRAPQGIADTNNNPILKTSTVGVTAVNYIEITNAETGQEALLQAAGSDTDVDLWMLSKGTGVIKLNDFQWMTADGVAGSYVTTNGSGVLSLSADAPVTSITGTEFQVLANGTFGTPETGAITLTLPQDIATTSSPTFSNLQLNGANILDANGNNILNFVGVSPMANYFTVNNSITGSSPALTVSGSDTNIGVILRTKGTGAHNLYSANTTVPLSIFSGTSYQHVTNMQFSNTSATRTVTWQDATGTVAFLSDIPSVTPSALTKNDDTNVTLALGGSPSTALLQSVSLTLGWTGVLADSRGGTGISSLGTGVATALGLAVTGSGGIALAASPTFTTPTLGAASATSLTFSSTTGIIGTTTNDNAPSGSVGYYVSSVIGSGSAVSLTNLTPANVTSISLPAGDFDVWGNVTFLASGTTSVSFICGWISSTSATQPNASLTASLNYEPNSVLTNVVGFTVPSFRVSLSSTTTIYLSVTSIFSVSTLSVCGGIYARERR